MKAFRLPQSLPSAQDVALAREGSRALSTMLQTCAPPQQINIRDDRGVTHNVGVPGSALRLLQEALHQISQGNTVSIVTIDAELTTQEAASVLGISRPFLVQLLEKGELPFRKIGTHRRVRYQHVIDYKQRLDAEDGKRQDMEPGG